MPIVIKNERYHEIVSGDSPTTSEELAFLILHCVDKYVWADKIPDYVGALGAIELAKHEILERRKK